MKKIIALTLVFAMAFTGIAFAESLNMDDIKKELTDYGIITDYNIETISRAEAVKIILTMKCIENLGNVDTVFTDVKAEHWASGYIDIAYYMGIVNGMGDGTFVPEAKLTNEQFIKMLVEVLGYEPMAEDRGGYPHGYMKIAQTLGLLKGLDIVANWDIKREDAAIMVHNALDKPIMQQVGFGSDAAYAVMDGTGGRDKWTLRMELDGDESSINPPDYSVEYHGENETSISNFKTLYSASFRLPSTSYFQWGICSYTKEGKTVTRAFWRASEKAAYSISDSIDKNKVSFRHERNVGLDKNGSDGKEFDSPYTYAYDIDIQVNLAKDLTAEDITVTLDGIHDDIHEELHFTANDMEQTGKLDVDGFSTKYNTDITK